MLVQMFDLEDMTQSKSGIDMVAAMNVSGTSHRSKPLDKGTKVQLNHTSNKSVKRCTESLCK